MARKPLDPDSPGGRSPAVHGRIPHSLHNRLTDALDENGMTMSEFLRDAAEAELDRIARQVVDVLDGKDGPWGEADDSPGDAA